MGDALDIQSFEFVLISIEEVGKFLADLRLHDRSLERIDGEEK